MTAVNLTPVAAVRVPAAGLRHQVRGAAVVWQREMIRFGRDRSRISPRSSSRCCSCSCSVPGCRR